MTKPTIADFVGGLCGLTEHFARSYDGRYASTELVSLSDINSPSADRNIAVVRRELSADEREEVIELAFDFYGRDSGWMILDVFDNELVRSDWTSLRATVMGRHEFAGPAIELTEGIEVREVTTEGDVKHWDEITAIGFDNLVMQRARPDQRHDARILGADMSLWLAWCDGRPIATSASFRTDSTNMVVSVCTLPEYRRRRIASSMTATAIACSPLPATLGADPGADSVYTRLGFEPLDAFVDQISVKRRAL